MPDPDFIDVTLSFPAADYAEMESEARSMDEPIEEMIVTAVRQRAGLLRADG